MDHFLKGPTFEISHNIHNNNIILNNDDSNTNINNSNTFRLRGNSFIDKLLDYPHNINIINTPILNGTTNKNNNNFLINTNNQTFFTKM